MWRAGNRRNLLPGAWEFMKAILWVGIVGSLASIVLAAHLQHQEDVYALMHESARCHQAMKAHFHRYACLSVDMELNKASESFF